jgi:putative PIN family toxin of toxin-antitoxin system
MNVVVDTNVLVSGLINPNGNPAKILNMILNSNLTVLFDERILSEYRNVLKREKFGFPDDLINPLIEFIRSEGISVISEPAALKFRDEEDKKFYEVALTGKADYLITGNKNHFPNKKFIVNPTEFLKRIL